MIWTKDFILKIIANPKGTTTIEDKVAQNRWLIYKMLAALYARQTESEKETKLTFHENGVGFNGFDAPFLSDVAERSKPFKNLTESQAVAVAKRIKKYIRQLEEIA